MKKWNSFAVKSPTEIVHQVSHPVAGHRMSVYTGVRVIANLDSPRRQR